MQPSHSTDPGRAPATVPYVLTFAALLLLTTGTLALSFLPHGAWTVPATIGIALLKSILIALYFMHLREEPASSWIALLISFLMVATLVGLATLDVASRWLD